MSKHLCFGALLTAVAVFVSENYAFETCRRTLLCDWPTLSRSVAGNCCESVEEAAGLSENVALAVSAPSNRDRTS